MNGHSSPGSHWHGDAHAHRGAHDHADDHAHAHGDGANDGADHRANDGADHRHSRLVGFVRTLVRPHSHDHADSLDDELLVSKAGTRALAVSLVGLLVTAVAQLVIVLMSGSVGLLADSTHNFADALTALPLGLAFVVSRRGSNRRYTYGYGRAEDLAGLAVVAVITLSAAVAAGQSIDRLVHPRPVSHLGWVAAAGLIGFAGNELAARYRIRVGRRIGSAALVADGHHARTDGFTSLAVVLGAAGVAMGWPAADPLVGLVITGAILVVLRGAARDVYRRLMDAVDPALVDQIEAEVGMVEGVQGVDGVRVRWIGHQLHAEVEVRVDRRLQVAGAHDVAELVRHHLLHRVRRLTEVVIHTHAWPEAGPDPHHLTAHHHAHAHAH